MPCSRFFAPLSHRNSEKTFHFHNISHPGRLAFLRTVWCLLGLSGEGLPPTSMPGREPASTASGPRFIATLACSCSQSPSRSDVFLISTLIWWDPRSTVAVAISFSLSLTTHPNGWKQFLCQTFPGGMRQSFNFFLDFPLWSARDNHF
jgi:hypothetical protein